MIIKQYIICITFLYESNQTRLHYAFNLIDSNMNTNYFVAFLQPIYYPGKVVVVVDGEEVWLGAPQKVPRMMKK